MPGVAVPRDAWSAVGSAPVGSGWLRRLAGLPRRGVQRSWVRELRWLAVAEAATVFATVVVLQLWRAHPSVPFYSSFDVSLQGGTIKTVLERGWYLDNPRLGFPTGANLRDFPLGDGWHFVFLRLFSIGSRDWALAMNTLYLGTFLLVGASAYLALRCLHTRQIVAAGGAIVTALLPFHFARNEMHVFLSDYSAVPLVVALAVAQLSDRAWLRVCGRVSTKRLRWVGAVAIVVWAGGTGTYYAVLSALLLWCRLNPCVGTISSRSGPASATKVLCESGLGVDRPPLGGRYVTLIAPVFRVSVTPLRSMRMAGPESPLHGESTTPLVG
jgi:hypothetical protein